MDNPVILFDGICNLCNSSVNFIINNDKNRLFRFAPMQSEAGKSILNKISADSKIYNSVILIQDGLMYTKSSAALKIVSQLNFPYNLLSVFKIVPKFLLNKIYDFVAANRYNWFGRRDICMIPSKDIKNLFIE